jgi:hypothetical protein
MQEASFLPAGLLADALTPGGLPMAYFKSQHLMSVFLPCFAFLHGLITLQHAVCFLI